MQNTALKPILKVNEHDIVNPDTTCGMATLVAIFFINYVFSKSDRKI